MSKRFKITNTLFLACLFGLSINTLAQDIPVKDTTKRNAVTEEIEVVRSYKPVLADAVKIRRSPDLNDAKPFNPRVNYDILDKRLELNSSIRALEAQKLAKQKEEELKNNFAKLALGNLGTTLGQLNIATGQDEALQAGFNFDHLAMSGPLNLQKMSRQGLSAYGRSIGDVVVLEGKLGYNRNSNYFYGIDPAGSFTNPNPEKQRFNFIEGEGTIFNRLDADDETALGYAAKLNASLFNNAFSAKETAFAISGGASKALNKFTLGANGVIDFTTSNDSSYNFKNHFFKLNPYLKIGTDAFKLTVGINYVNEFGANQRINIFPAASLDFMLIKNYLTVFGSFGGDVDKTRLKGLTDINPFLNENVLLRNTVKKIDAAGGIRGTFSANIGFKAAVLYQTVSDLSYFTNNFNQKQKFDVAYFAGNTNILGFTGELNVNFSDAFNVDSKINLRQYDNSAEHAWLLPGFTLNSTASFKINEQIKLEGDLYFQGDTKAQILNLNNSLPPYTIKNIPALADLSIGVEYQHNKKISGFVKANNILGKEYQRLPFYPNYGINILGGITYGF